MVQLVQKLVSIIFPITLIVLTLLRFIRASQKHAETDVSHTIKKHNMHKWEVKEEVYGFWCIYWGMGTAISLPGIINVYTGLQAYHKRTSKSINLWTIIFTTEVSVIAFFYLFQDKWNYIQKQGVILGNEPIRPINQDLSPWDKKNDFN